MSNVRDVLIYIQNNPNCNSSGVDCYIVKDLFERGLVYGEDITSSSSPTDFEYQNLRLTALGLDFIEQPTASKQGSLFRVEKLWIPILLVVISFGLTYWIK
ncbi:hypothetical protein [Motilimonas sp. KMU-193]|uniref:hypothetical protein n=1 Tax=Motilimonas sp. KMU-193 TaxID=3388668 RepID=UPI00396B1D1C